MNCGSRRCEWTQNQRSPPVAMDHRYQTRRFESWAWRINEAQIIVFWQLKHAAGVFLQIFLVIYWFCWLAVCFIKRLALASHELDLRYIYIYLYIHVPSPISFGIGHFTKTVGIIMDLCFHVELFSSKFASLILTQHLLEYGASIAF